MKYVSEYNIIKKLTTKKLASLKKANKFSNAENLKESDANSFLILNLYLSLSDDKINDSITDTSYVSSGKGNNIDDNGIDAIYIDETEKAIYLFNFKYGSSYETCIKNFPSSECHKIKTYLSLLSNYNNSSTILSRYNEKLKDKTKRIIDLVEDNTYEFFVVLASNYYLGLEVQAKNKFEEEIRSPFNCKLIEICSNTIMTKYIDRNKKDVKGKFSLSKSDFFPNKDNGDVSQITCKLKASQLIKLFVNDDKTRKSREDFDKTTIKDYKIDESLFEENVRVFLGKNTKVNDKICRTAKQTPEVFFNYNNGVTIICDVCHIGTGAIAPFTISNYQVVNGQQTIFSIFAAANSDWDCLDKIEVLCRIFATKNKQTRADIARYTNSQALVSDRDLSSLNYVQILLNAEFELAGKYYERKENQYEYQNTKLRYDSAKVGQLLIAFNLEEPHIARGSAKKAFEESYHDKVFNENVTADSIVKIYEIFTWLNKKSKSAMKSYNRYSKYYVLVFFKLTYNKFSTNKVDIMDVNIDDIDNCNYHKLILNMMDVLIEKERINNIYFSEANYLKKKDIVESFKKILNGCLSSDDMTNRISQLKEENIRLREETETKMSANKMFQL